ncbi:ABC transporter substrate-binding protein [Massilia sp. S19_KUP03_FR1]|uniref:ABC transporter substrate-binding protein n=1 Tax=Massilia sp. S19_KUP03_FR1 TaxID=3025503 RepID=UPI002FCDCB88
MLKHALRWPSAVLFTLLAAALPAGATPGVTANTIVLGQSAALTGPSAQLGIEMRDGAQAWFDHINSKGGVAGRKIVLKTLDDGYDAAQAVKNTQQLVHNDNVFALFGYVGQATSTASMRSVEKEDVPFFAPLAGGESLHGQFRPNVFNIRAGNVLEMEKIIENLKGMGAKKIAAVYYNDAPGKAIFDVFERTLKTHNLALLGSATVERNSTDVSAAVAKLRPLQATAVLIITAYPASAAFIRGMRKDAISVPFFWNLSFTGSQGLASALGKDAAGVMISQVMPSPWNKNMALNKEYTKLYLNKPGSAPGFSSLEGFIAAKAFVKGLERAGKNLTRASFREGVEGLNGTDLGGFTLKFSPTNHEASSYVELTVIRNDGTFLY